MAKITKNNGKEKASSQSLRDKFESLSNKAKIKSNSTNSNLKKQTKVKRVSKNTKLSKAFRIIGLILMPMYFRNSWKELKQVTWPNFKLSRQLTLAVIIFAVFFGVSIALVDSGLSRVFKVILLK